MAGNCHNHPKTCADCAVSFMGTGRQIRCTRCGEKAYGTSAEDARQRARDWYTKNRSSQAIKVSAYRREHPEMVRKARNGWAARNVDRVRICKATCERRRNFRKRVQGGLIDRPTPKKLAYLLESQGRSCAYCGQHVWRRAVSGDGAYHVDHVVPLLRGGTDSMENVLIACARCNHSKHNRTLGDWLERRLAS